MNLGLSKPVVLENKHTDDGKVYLQPNANRSLHYLFVFSDHVCSFNRYEF